LRPDVRTERGRRTNVRRYRLRRGAFLTAQLALLGFLAVYLCLNSSIFKLSGFAVEGNSLVTSQDIAQATGFPYGANIWKLTLAQGEAGVMALPIIGAAKISRIWPNRLRVVVTERVVIGHVPYHSSFLAVDAEGRVLAVGDNLSLASLPIITGVPVGDGVHPGVALRGEEMELAASCLIALGREWWPKVGEVNVGTGGQILLYLRGGIPVYLGRQGRELGAAMANLAAVLADLEKSHIVPEYIDLRFGGKPVVKPKSGRP
jgi:cell division septal protein FtsQ